MNLRHDCTPGGGPVVVSGTADRNPQRLDAWRERYRATFGFYPRSDVGLHRMYCNQQDVGCYRYRPTR